MSLQIALTQLQGEKFKQYNETLIFMKISRPKEYFDLYYIQF